MSLWLATLRCLLLWIEPRLWWILTEKRCYIGITESVQLGTKNARMSFFCNSILSIIFPCNLYIFNDVMPKVLTRGLQRLLPKTFTLTMPSHPSVMSVVTYVYNTCCDLPSCVDSDLCRISFWTLNNWTFDIVKKECMFLES